MKNKKPNGYWTFEKCKEVALLCSSRSEFQKKYNGAYESSTKNGWLDEISSHMMEHQKPNNYWNKERCYEVALKCETRSKFSEKYNGAYNSALNHKWLDEICNHMSNIKIYNIYWNKERCYEAALKCETRSEFNKKYSGAYNSSLRNGWMNDICSHMKIVGNLYKRCIYVWEFEDKSAYIGLTDNIDRRKKDHITSSNSPVFKKLKKYKGNCKQLTEYIDVRDAQKMECFVIENYQNNNWIILNKAKAGALGGYLKWSYEKCKDVSKECFTRNEFCNKFHGAYKSAKKFGWLDEICSHMIEIQKPNGYWTFEKCKEVALLSKTRDTFQRKYSGAYNVARLNNWLDVLCSHMNEIHKPNGYWSYEKCKEAALLCHFRKEFEIKYKQAYKLSSINKWLDDICSHMKRPQHHIKWTKENCHKKALECVSRIEFYKNHQSAYNSSIKNGWLDEICSHMIVNTKPRGYWTFERCKEEFLKYKDLKDFIKGSKIVYVISKRNNWINNFI